MVYQEPYVARSYGNANWSYVTSPQYYQNRGYTNSYAQMQGYGQNARADARFGGAHSLMSKRFYMALRAGMGKTSGWDENEKTGKVSDPVGAVLSLSLGAYLTPNIRMDGEFAYHIKDDLYRGNDIYIEGKGEYSQMDFGLNAYYDFNRGSSFRPFIGIGIWGIQSKIHSNIVITQYGDTRDTSKNEMNFALSGALGAAYHVTDTFALELMGRARYIFDEDIYNLEGLIGTRFSF